MIRYFVLVLTALIATPAMAGPLPDLSWQSYPAPVVKGERIATYSPQALKLTQYVRRGWYGTQGLLRTVYQLDALEMAVVTDLISEGYGFRFLSRQPGFYDAQWTEVYRRLNEKAKPLGLHYSRVPSWERFGSTGRPGLQLIAAMLKEGR